ncbi:unnamed protein product [Lota lota]
MSRRRVSVGELGPVDLQGWLQRQTGTRLFMGSVWRRNWFVLKNSYLYWYPSHMVRLYWYPSHMVRLYWYPSHMVRLYWYLATGFQKADGFLDLTDFTIQPIRIYGKQHVIKISQRDVATVVMAAESFTEMSLWLDKLSAALLQTRAAPRSRRECYSQVSDPESEDSVFYSCPPYTELPTSEPVNGELPPPCFTSSPFYNHVLASQRSRRTTSTSRTSSTSSASTSRTSSSESSEAESRPDDAETSSSPIGRTKPSNQRGRRGSSLSPFSSERRRENLHLVRILNPPPKREEADLLAMEAVLTDPTLHALRFWNWRQKFILLQEIPCHKWPAGGARDLRIPATIERNVAETSV